MGIASQSSARNRASPGTSSPNTSRRRGTSSARVTVRVCQSLPCVATLYERFRSTWRVSPMMRCAVRVQTN